MTAADQIETIRALVGQGQSNEQVAVAIGSSERSVRRARKRFGISAAELAAGASVTDAADFVVPRAVPPPTRLERAERAAQGAQTAEDVLRDRLEEATAKLRRADALLKREGQEERHRERVVSAIEASVGSLTQDSPVRRPSITRQGAKTRPQELVALLSDAHGGEVVDPEQAMGIQYDWDICVRRLEHWRDSIIKYADLATANYQIPKLWVPVLGDMISGDIHEELEITNEMPLVQQAIAMGDVLAGLGRDLAGYFPEVEFIVMPGNHPRLKKKQPNKNRAADNMEYVMGTIMDARLDAIENVHVRVTKQLVEVITVAGKWRIGLQHGDGVKSNSFAGIPYYGLSQRRDKIQALMRQRGEHPLDMLCMGHFHQYVCLGGICKVVINGAIKGGDEFTIANYMSATDPEQLLMSWHPENGLTDQKHITFDDQ